MKKYFELILIIGMVLIFCSSVHAVDLKAGDPAPDFSLEGSDGKTYQLKELAGKVVVIAWFPKAFTRG